MKLTAGKIMRLNIKTNLVDEFYFSFQKLTNSEVQKLPSQFHFSLLSIIEIITSTSNEN